MQAGQGLPEWIGIVQALLVPVIAGIGAWIALQQMHLASVRLRHDLFDRRFAILQSTQRMLVEVLTDARISDGTFAHFSAGTGAARFIFGESVADYLHEVRGHAVKLYSLQTVLRDMEAGHEKARAASAEGAEVQWLVEQLDGLGARFQPYLQLDRRWNPFRCRRPSY